MINAARFERTLALAFLPLLVMATWMVLTPTVALSLAGAPESPGARLALDELRIDQLRLSGTTVEGVEVAEFDIGRILRSTDLIIERDVAAESLVPGAGIYTLRVAAPTATIDGLDLYTSRACVKGVGLTNFGLLQGLVDPFLNDAIADGFDQNLIAALLNLIGPSGFVDFTVAEFRAETVALRADTLRAGSGLDLTFERRRVSPAFDGTCLS